MVFTVHVAAFDLYEDRWVLRVGDEVSFGMFVEEAGRELIPTERLQRITGVAQLLPSWPGAEFGRHPVRVDAGGAALYWDAPDPVEGDVEFVGAVRRDSVDAPAGFPATCGVVRRVRMEWREHVHTTPRSWTVLDDRARYDDVDASFFPKSDDDRDPTTGTISLDPELPDRIASAAPPAGFQEIVVMSLSTHPEFPLGTTKTTWTGVLLDLEITGTQA